MEKTLLTQMMAFIESFFSLGKKINIPLRAKQAEL